MYRLTRAGNMHARTHTKTNIQCLLLFHSKNAFSNAPQCYLISTMPVLLFLFEFLRSCYNKTNSIFQVLQGHWMYYFYLVPVSDVQITQQCKLRRHFVLSLIFWQTSKNCKDDRAINVFRSVKGALRSSALLREIRKKTRKQGKSRMPNSFLGKAMFLST
jgi:hypothetical protein